MQSDPHYSGTGASAAQVLALAEEYRTAARQLLPRGRPGLPPSWAPIRILAIHGIELYLNALLLHNGLAPEAIRGLRHDLDQRAAISASFGIVLRQRTVAHLRALHINREYLSARYGPELARSWSQINRPMATLEEVGDKVALRIVNQAANQRPNPRSEGPNGCGNKSERRCASYPAPSPAAQ